MSAMTYENILVETRDRVGIIRLNRPQRMNALNDALADELGRALAAFDADAGIGAIVITGNEKAFAAGADIGAMAEWDYQKVYADNYIMQTGSRCARTRKPVIAAVAGYALGGGCELAMMCDLIIAADTAKFGQPEITIGTMPGHGRHAAPAARGRQGQGDGLVPDRPHDRRRRSRALAGWSRASCPRTSCETRRWRSPRRSRRFSLPVVLKIKEAINRAYESSLAEGLLFERREFHATFALDDQKEGMRAFVEKRKPEFKHR